LIKFIIQPENVSEGGWADEKAAVKSEHLGDVAKMFFDTHAVGSTTMQSSPEFNDETGAQVVVFR